MLEREPSRTALAAAAYRAAHQVLDHGRVFADPLAVKILGVHPAAFLQHPEIQEAQRGMRFFVVGRAKIAETALAAGVDDRGINQLVVLGAGLDTFAYRNPFGARLRVFEVDHPATQAWKRRRLSQADVPIPESVVYVAVDFEREKMVESLAQAGLDPRVRTLYTRLGGVTYISLEANDLTLRRITAHPAGAEVVFDYGEPRDRIDPALQVQCEERASRVAAAGEPFLSYFVPEELHAKLRQVGFTDIDDLDVPSMIERLTGVRARTADPPATAPPPRTGGHVLLAATPL